MSTLSPTELEARLEQVRAMLEDVVAQLAEIREELHELNDSLHHAMLVVSILSIEFFYS